MIPGWGRYPGEGNGNPPQYSYLENPLDSNMNFVTNTSRREREIGIFGWGGRYYSVYYTNVFMYIQKYIFSKSRNINNFISCSLSICFPGGSDVKVSACNAGDLGSIPGLGSFPWRRKWQTTPEFLPGESHGFFSITHIPLSIYTCIIPTSQKPFQNTSSHFRTLSSHYHQSNHYLNL